MAEGLLSERHSQKLLKYFLDITHPEDRERVAVRENWNEDDRRDFQELLAKWEQIDADHREAERNRGDGDWGSDDPSDWPGVWV